MQMATGTHFFFSGRSDKQQFFQVSQIGILSNLYSHNPQIIMEAGFANFTVKKIADLDNNHYHVKARLLLVGFGVFMWEMEVEFFLNSGRC